MQSASLGIRYIDDEAAFSADRFSKFLVLKYSIKNLESYPVDAPFGWFSVRVPSIDRPLAEWRRTAASTSQIMPGQSVSGASVLTLRANAVVDALSVLSGGSEIGRISLSRSIKVDFGPYGSAATAPASSVPLAIGKSVPIGQLDVTVKSARSVGRSIQLDLMLRNPGSQDVPVGETGIRAFWVNASDVRSRAIYTVAAGGAVGVKLPPTLGGRKSLSVTLVVNPATAPQSSVLALSDATADGRSIHFPKELR